MKRKKQNATALDLWEQVFSRLSQQGDATLWATDHDKTNDEMRLRAGLAEAGWSSEEIEERLAAQQDRARRAPVTSPGVNPHVEAWFAKLSDDVEAAMVRLGLDSYAKVARGIEPRIGPFASKTNVIMTDESIVTVGSFLFRFCGLIARAFTRTLLLNPFFWDSAAYTDIAGRALFRNSPKLMLYWFHIFASFSATGTHALVPFQPSSRNEVMLFEQIARAMEIFAVAHEYGHHHLQHGRNIDADPHFEEFEADQFALQISYEVDKVPLILPNPYLTSGAGGVVLLLALQILRRAEDIVHGKRSGYSELHPIAAARINRFDSISALKPVEFGVLRNFRTVAKRVMFSVEEELLPTMRALRPQLRQFALSLRS
jgi:hypothetical protein